MNFLDEVKKKINQELKPESIILIDNSHLHTKHKYFDSNKYHLKIKIQSKELKSLGKIEAHKKIFSVLKNEMDSKIHALEIEIN
tara:strand:+ start:1919 stop:2170 length:252 start_codon:yes stop_codon:yes gene_type:complete